MSGAVAARNGTTPTDDLYSRWQTMQLLAVFTMVERSAPRAGFDHDRYDLTQLALRAIDFVVVHQASVDGSAGSDHDQLVEGVDEHGEHTDQPQVQADLHSVGAPTGPPGS